MKKIIASSMLLLFSSVLQAQSVTGILDEVYPIQNRIIVNGVAYHADVENVAIYYKHKRISREHLTPGDEVNLILIDQQDGSVEKEIKTIILIRGQKEGPGG